MGARLDEKPELLFVLRQVDHLELIEKAAAGAALTTGAAADKKTIADRDLADVFGIEIDAGDAPAALSPAAQKTAAKTSADKTAKAVGYQRARQKSRQEIRKGAGVCAPQEQICGHSTNTDMTREILTGV